MNSLIFCRTSPQLYPQAINSLKSYKKPQVLSGAKKIKSLQPIKKLPVQEVLAKREQLILLDPHPDANGADHALQSPTFIELINKHLVNYCESRGVQK